ANDIVPLCQQAIQTPNRTRQEGVACRLGCPVAHFTMQTDAYRLSQVLINLLTNAGKFTSEGSITLGVLPDKALGEVRFSVTDTGPGIPLDKQERVFDRFEKLEGNLKHGTGLGLAICRQIVTIFGGRIWIDPDYTDGARFVFTLPIAPQKKKK
ncbi:MAG: HAMP domain-containing histidine kinase, partial [Alistipes sp.]|nr:HAMP domain-containing histidine kinase [Alistipes sp.]